MTMNNNLFIKTQQNAHENNNNFQGSSLNTNNNSLNFKIENIFCCPIYIAEKPNYVSSLNKASDPVIKRITDRHKKEKLPIPNSYHSENLWIYPEFSAIANEIMQQGWNILSWQGYDLTNRVPMLTELWVQEFPKEGGFHDIHIHGNNQISGFYFLKCSEATSHPVFHDPRPGKVMTDLLAKDSKKVNYNTNQVHYKVKPGTFIFFNSYMPHSYIHHKGKETFRFIHFNMQAGMDPKSVQKT
jgi:uncharacterized protein (TIGR02466 family)